MNRTVGRRGSAAARVVATPYARRLAREAGISVADLRGSGPAQRVIARDVRSFLAARSTGGDRPVMSEHSGAQGNSPQAAVRRTIRVDALLDLCARLIEPRRSLVSADDLLVKAAAHAHIGISESQRGAGPIDIAVAVVTDSGLQLPVLRDVGTRSVSSVSAGLAELRDGVPHDPAPIDVALSIANFGRYGVEEFTVCLPPSDRPTLTLGAARPEPVVVDGALTVATVIHATLSFDPRSLGPELGAQWLAAFAATVENPLRILT